MPTKNRMTVAEWTARQDRSDRIRRIMAERGVTLTAFAYRWGVCYQTAWRRLRDGLDQGLYESALTALDRAER